MVCDIYSMVVYYLTFSSLLYYHDFRKSLGRLDSPAYHGQQSPDLDSKSCHGPLCSDWDRVLVRDNFPMPPGLFVLG